MINAPSNVVSYLRCSGRGQVDGDSFPRQRAAVNAFATANGMTVQQEFIDEAVSGTKDSSDRPAMVAMIAMMQASGVSTVLVETSSRFARDLIVSEILVKRFQANGFRVIDCSGKRVWSVLHSSVKSSSELRQTQYCMRFCTKSPRYGVAGVVTSPPYASSPPFEKRPHWIVITSARWGQELSID